jgi:hypothetical protein
MTSPAWFTRLAALGFGTRDPGIVAVTAYRMHQRWTERMRVGRVLLIGDATHVTNPTGGSGSPAACTTCSACWIRSTPSSPAAPRITDSSRCLLSSGSRVRILPGAPSFRSLERFFVLYGGVSRRLPATACHFRTRGVRPPLGVASLPSVALAAAPTASAIALSAAGRMQVGQRGPRAAVARTLHRLPEVRACGRQRVTCMPALVAPFAVRHRVGNYGWL